jgi:L-ascorbate metabolism protein UlaG (beta-lactamase superfamily)
MRLQLIRNATLLLDYAGRHILTDPFFAPKHSRPSFTGKSPNPLADLPILPEHILDGVELVVISHLHADHFDPVAHELVPKRLPILCQPGDEQTIREKGFQAVTPVADALNWSGLSITRTAGHHGLGEVGTMMGNVSGFVFQADGEPTLYWAGDTLLCDEVRAVIARFQPAVIVTHSSGATWPDKAGQRGLIVMDAAQTVDVCRLAPTSTVIPIHLDSLDHGTVSRADLRAEADHAGVDRRQLRIPADGEIIQIDL